MSAIATAQDEPLGERNMSAALRKENGHGYEIVPPIPKPEENLDGKLYDPQGNTVAPAYPTIMARVEAKGSEDVTLKKSTLWLLGAGVVILQLVFNYGGSMLAWAREDESQKGDIRAIAASVEAIAASQVTIQSQITNFSERLRQQEIQAAKIDGFKAGVAESQTKEH